MADIPDAIKLLNDWRDSAYYSCAAATSITVGIASGLVELAILAGASCIFMRESLRTAAWFNDVELQLAVAGKKINTSKACVSAGAVTAAAGALVYIPTISFSAVSLISGTEVNVANLTRAIIEMCLYSTASYAVGQKAGGPKAIYKLYKDLLFDYPRKKGGGGNTETQRLKNTFKVAGGYVADLIRPAPAPVPIPVNARRVFTSRIFTIGN